MQPIVRNLRILLRAEFLLAGVRARIAGQKIGLFAFAILIGVFALGMLNLAGYFALEPSQGRVHAALIVAGVDLLIAGAAAGLAGRLRPGPEVEMVQEVRQMALSEIEAEVESFQEELRSLRNEIKEAKETLTSFAKNPLDALGPSFLVPLLSTLTSLLRAGKK